MLGLPDGGEGEGCPEELAVVQGGGAVFEVPGGLEGVCGVVEGDPRHESSEAGVGLVELLEGLGLGLDDLYRLLDSIDDLCLSIALKHLGQDRHMQTLFTTGRKIVFFALQHLPTVIVHPLPIKRHPRGILHPHLLDKLTFPFNGRL